MVITTVDAAAGEAETLSQRCASKGDGIVQCPD